MHPYATDSKERTIIPFFIAALGVVLAWIIHELKSFTPYLQQLWWLDAPAAMGSYGIIHAVFDKYIWKRGWIRTLLQMKVPILTGTWTGHLTSSFDDHKEQLGITVEIRQSWRRFSVILQTETSRSHSEAGSILTNDPSGVILRYEYLNEPNSSAIGTMNPQRGTTRLLISNGGNKLEGQYYTGRGRETFGSIVLTRT